MSIFNLFLQAVRDTWSRKRMIVLVWGVTLLFSVPAFWAVQRPLRSHFGMTSVPDEWLTQFNANYLLEMLVEQPLFFQTVTSVLTAMGLLYLLVSILLSGGVVGGLQTKSPDKFFARFIGDGGKFFGRFLRLFLWTLLLSAASLIFLLIPVAGILFVTVALGITRCASDIAKFRLAADAGFKVTKTYFSSLGWVVKNFFRVASVYLMSLLMLLAAFAIYRLADPTPHSVVTILWMFLLQQAFVLFRTSIKIQMLASARLLWQTAPKETVSPNLTHMPLEPGVQT